MWAQENTMALKPAAQNRLQLKPLISVIVGHRDFDLLNPDGQSPLLYETILCVNSMALSEAVWDTSKFNTRLYV
jgi:hypothetical protein